MENILIQNESLKVQISPLGAEIQSVVDQNNAERMWQGDPKFWTGRAPILFPFAGGLKDGYFIYGGNKYTMPQHGFARTSVFKVETQKEDSVTFLLDEQKEEYPFHYALRARFTLKGNALIVDYIVNNNGEDKMYYGIGCHEAYSIPEGVDHIKLVFDREEDLQRSILEGAQITEKYETMGRGTNELKLRTEHFRDDTLVFLHLNSRGVTMESDVSNARVRVDFDGFDSLLIWQKPRAPYLCIEPWVNPPEYTTHDHIFSHKPGIVELPKGAQNTHTHTITFL